MQMVTWHFHPVAMVLGILILATISGCRPPAPRLLFPGDDHAKGGAVGYLVRGAALQVVDTLANAPVGATAVAGINVKALDVRGTEVATTVTGADGRFEMASLPTGFTSLELRGIEKQPVPELVVEFTAIPDHIVPVGRSYVVQRSAARDIAMQSVPPSAIVVATLNPLPAGTILYPPIRPGGGFPSEADSFTIASDAWLFRVDLTPDFEFAHPLEYVLVDATTSAVTRIPTEYPLLVNHGHLWTNYDNCFQYPFSLDLIYLAAELPSGSYAVATSEIVQMADFPDPGREFVYPPNLPQNVYDLAQDALDPEQEGDAKTHFNNQGSDGVFVVMIRALSDHYGRFNLATMVGALAWEGVPGDQMTILDLSGEPVPELPPLNYPPPPPFYGPFLQGPNSLEEWQEGYDLAKQKQRNDIMAAYLERAVLSFEPRIEERLTQGKHSTLIVYINGHGGYEKVLVDFEGARSSDGVWDFGPEELGITKTQACRVRLILQACYGEAFTKKLETLFAGTPHDIKLFSASSVNEEAPANQAVFSYLPGPTPWLRPAGSHYTLEFADELDVENGDLASVTEIDDTGKEVLIEDLASIGAHPPDPIVRPGHPGWCFPPGSTRCALRGTFTDGEGDCGYATNFTDTFNLAIDGGIMTLSQPSTSDVTTGFIDEEGAFEIARIDGADSYVGVFDASTCSGIATNRYVDVEGCITTYDVAFEPL